MITFLRSRDIVLTMIVNHHFYIPHDFPVSSMCFSGHHLDAIGPCLKNACRLRVEDEWDGEEAFDPFCFMLASLYNMRKCRLTWDEMSRESRGGGARHGRELGRDEVREVRPNRMGREEVPIN